MMGGSRVVREWLLHSLDEDSDKQYKTKYSDPADTKRNSENPAMNVSL